MYIRYISMYTVYIEISYIYIHMTSAINIVYVHIHHDTKYVKYILHIDRSY